MKESNKEIEIIVLISIFLKCVDLERKKEVNGWWRFDQLDYIKWELLPYEINLKKIHTNQLSLMAYLLPWSILF